MAKRQENYVEHLRKLTPTTLRTSMIDIYDNTGKEESKFFPLLNYTATEILGVSSTKACERKAVEWVNDNLDYIITPSIPPSFPNCVDTDFTVLPIIKKGKAEDCTINLGSSTKFNGIVLGMSLIMYHDKNATTVVRRLNGFSSKAMLSVCFILSDTFRDILSNMKKALDSFPSLKHVLRSSKEYKTPNIALRAMPFSFLSEEYKEPNKAMPFSSLSDFIRKRYGDDIVFPLIHVSGFLFDGEAYICHYNARNGSCNLFNGNSIMGIQNTNTLTVKEADENVFRDLIRGYRSVMDHMREMLDSMEAQRNNLLNLF